MSRCSLCLLALALFVGACLIGCGTKARPEVDTSEDVTPQPAAQGDHAPTPPVAGEPPPIERDRLHQSFADATLSADNPPAGENVAPVNQTMTHKSGPALTEQVARAWDGIRFVTTAGQKILYTAEIHTNRGVIKIALLPDISPNHARNFIVLSRLGYYDGLRFDRIYHEKDGENELHCIEAGSPSGTGDEGTGSLGYWLKDELTPSDKLSHTPGVVGACRIEKDTAATKFYINLNNAPFRDGNQSLFGVVLDGMDVANTIAKQPLAQDGELPSKPKQAVIIHKVLISESLGRAGEK